VIKTLSEVVADPQVATRKSILELPRDPSSADPADGAPDGDGRFAQFR